MSSSELNKLISGIKDGTEGTLKLSSNVIENSNVSTNFPSKLLLTNRQVSRIREAFANGSSANMKFSKPQLHKIGQSGRFLGRPQGSLLKMVAFNEKCTGTIS